MTAQQTHSRLLSGMGGNGRRAKRRRTQFPEPIRSGSRPTRVTPANTPETAATDVSELVKSALVEIPPLDLTGIDDLLSAVSS